MNTANLFFVHNFEESKAPEIIQYKGVHAVYSQFFFITSTNFANYY